MKTKRTRINEREYSTIKQLLSLGLKVSQVVAVTKRSDSTIKSINRSTDMRNYLDTIREYTAKRQQITQAQDVQTQTVSQQEARNELTTQTVDAPADWFADMLKEARDTNKLLAMLVNSSRLNNKGWFK